MPNFTIMKITMLKFIFIAFGSLIINGCETIKQSTNQQRGVAVGATSGAVIGGVLGNNIGNFCFKMDFASYCNDLLTHGRNNLWQFIGANMWMRLV